MPVVRGRPELHGKALSTPQELVGELVCVSLAMSVKLPPAYTVLPLMVRALTVPLALGFQVVLKLPSVPIAANLLRLAAKVANFYAMIKQMFNPYSRNI